MGRGREVSFNTLKCFSALGKIFFNPITIVNTALFVLNFLNLPPGDILTRSEKHFEEEGHFSSSAHLVPRQVNETVEEKCPSIP